MRSTSVFALFLLCSPIFAGCSGIGQATGALPASGTSSGVVPQSTSLATGNPIGATSATGTTGVTGVTGASVATAATNFSFPNDFPTNAVAGARQRFTSAKWDQGGASSPTVSLEGPGSNGAQTSTYVRSDGSVAVAVYFPSHVSVAKGWLAVKLGVSDRVPLMSTANDSAAWTDTAPDLAAAAIFYFTPTRVLLIDLIGSGTSPSPRPSSSAAPRPSASPISTSVPDESSCTHFVANPVCHQLPAHPNVSANSSAWASLEFQPGRNYIPSFNAKVGPHPFADSSDSSDPPLDELTTGGASIPQVIDCDLSSWGRWACGQSGIQGKTLNVPAAMQPAGNSDHHYSFNDDRARGEYDFWLVRNVPGSPGSTLHMGSGGFCDWSRDGTACSGSNATKIAGSLGSITEADFVRAESNPVHGSFGHAISFATLCADPSFVYPATASDGTNTNGSAACNGHTGAHERPPEGTRVYLDRSDEQVDAMNLPAYAKAWWRTLDREHEGGFIADTNWSGAPGLSPAFQRQDFSQQAREAGVNPVPYAKVPLGVGTIDMARDIKFCANGTC